MRGKVTSLRSLGLTAFTLAAAVAALLPTAGGADPSTSLRQRAVELRTKSDSLAARRQAALLQVYALDSRLAAARDRVVALQRRRAAVVVDRRSTLRHHELASRTLASAQQAVARRVRALYEHEPPDTLSVVLGADSLEQVVSDLDSLDRFAEADRHVIEQATRARRTLATLAHALAAHVTELSRVAAQTAASAVELEQARAGRLAYVADLRAEERLTEDDIATVESRARAAAERAAALPAPAPPPAAGAVAGAAEVAADQPARAPYVEAESGRVLTVSATGYSLPGATATGLPVGWGIVAVDPNMIPLGTQMTIPGYGEGIAADVGSAVQGAAIDLWFPSRAQALAWGRRTVTITLH